MSKDDADHGHLNESCCLKRFECGLEGQRRDEAEIAGMRH